MKQKWGREEYVGNWPSERRVWTMAAFFVALASVVAIYVYRYERVWTPLQRFLVVGDALPLELREACCVGSARKVIFMRDCTADTQHAFGHLYQTADGDSRLR